MAAVHPSGQTGKPSFLALWARFPAKIALTVDCLKRAAPARRRLETAEIDIIASAMEEAAAKGFDVSDPHPADTVFRPLNGGFHAVLTMYQYQGQIAMKLLGFDRGVTMLGGLPFPVCTPSHGAAYKIAGKGVDNPRACEEVVLLAARMTVRQQAAGVQEQR